MRIVKLCGVDCAQDTFANLTLNLDGSPATTVGKFDFSSTGQINGNLADGPHGVSHRQVFDMQAVFNCLKEHLGGPHLERSRWLGNVRIANDHVHTTVRTGICQRFVTGVDDRA